MIPYSIMHLNRRVASVRADGTCTVYYPSFMPYNLYLEQGDDMDTRLNNISNFEHWCASRVLTLDRAYAKEILNALGKKQAVTDRDRAQIAIAYHALTLTDVYWVKAHKEKLTFEAVSLFHHSLSDAFVDVSLRGLSLTVQNASLLDPADAAGDVATQGVAPKAWVRRDGVFWLYKDGSPSEVHNELLASRIAQCFAVDQVRYEAKDYRGEPVSACRLVTSEARSLVNIESVDIYAANRDTTAHSIVMRRDPYGYHMMNIVDYLVGNTDRHWGNWGFWADNATNRLTKLYPLMDFNRAFGAYDTLEGARCQTAPTLQSQMEAALCGVRQIGLNQIAPISDDWFDCADRRAMLHRRLRALQDEA